MHIKILDKDGNYAFIDETTASKELLLGTVPISESIQKELMDSKCKISVGVDLKNTEDITVSMIKAPWTTNEILDRLMSSLISKGVITKTDVDSIITT